MKNEEDTLTTMNGIELYMRDIIRFPKMTKAREAELCKAYNKGVKKEVLENAKKELILGNLCLVIACAEKYYHNCKSIPFSALISKGNMVLVQASNRFKNNKGACFSTFAYNSIYKSFNDCYNEMDIIHIPGHHYTQRRLLEKAKKSSGKDNIDKKYVSKLGLTSNKMNRLDMSSKALNPVRIDMNESFHEILSDNTFREKLELKDLREFLDKQTSRLSERHRKALHMYYYDNCSFSDIGKCFNCTRSASHMIVKKALYNLHRHLVSKPI